MSRRRITMVSFSLLAVAGVGLGIALALVLVLPRWSAEAQVGTPNNRAPDITSVPVTEAVVGQQYIYQVIATDLDGDSLGYFLDPPPAGMGINSTTGLITWTPDASQVGQHLIEIIVEDGDSLAGGLNDFQEFIITVSPANGGGPRDGSGNGDTGNRQLLTQAIQVLRTKTNPEAVEEAINLGMDTFMGSRPLPTEGVDQAQKVHEQFSAQEQEFAQALTEYIQKVGSNGAHQGLALNALQIVQETNKIAQTLSPITSQCGPGDFVLQADTNNFFNPCSQLQPLMNSSTGLENEPVFSPGDTVFGQGGTFQPIDPLTRSYSVNLRADLVPPKWSRDIPEHVEMTGPLAPGECAVVFKEFRGLLMQLHIEAITAIKDPGNKSGMAGSTSEPLWVLRWMPAQYGKQWIMCNKGPGANPQVETKVTRQVVEDEGLVYFWRFYE